MSTPLLRCSFAALLLGLAACRAPAPPPADPPDAAPAFVHPPLDDAALEPPASAPGPRSPEEQELRKVEALRVQRERTQRHLDALPALIDRFVADSHPPRLPTSLWELAEPPEGRDPYTTPDRLRDGWSNDLLLEPRPPRGYLLRSVGPDDRYGTEDDMLLEPAAPPR